MKVDRGEIFITNEEALALIDGFRQDPDIFRLEGIPKTGNPLPDGVEMFVDGNGRTIVMVDDSETGGVIVNTSAQRAEVNLQRLP